MGLLEQLQAEKAAYMKAHGQPSQGPMAQPSPWQGLAASPTPVPMYPPGQAPIPQMDPVEMQKLVKGFRGVL